MFAVSNKVFPWQNDVAVLVIVAVGAVPDVNVIAELVALQEVPLLTTTVYDPVSVAV